MFLKNIKTEFTKLQNGSESSRNRATEGAVHLYPIY